MNYHYEIEKDSIVPGRYLTRFKDGSCRESLPVEVLVFQLQETIAALETRIADLEELLVAEPSTKKKSTRTSG